MSNEPDMGKNLSAGEIGSEGDSTAEGGNGSISVLAAGLSDRGAVRRRNEDAFLCDAERRLFLVADGMGGHVGGDQASAIAVQKLDEALDHDCLARLEGSDETEITNELNAALAAANEAILTTIERQPELLGMGCTIVLALILGSQVYVANLGDSRAYLIREKHIQQLTEDHSWAAVLVSREELTKEEARYSPMRNMLTGFLGSVSIKPAFVSAALQDGDRLLLCSDGLWDELPDYGMARIVGSHDDAASSVSSLIAAANEAGGKDNITAVVAHFCKVHVNQDTDGDQAILR